MTFFLVIDHKFLISPLFSLFQYISPLFCEKKISPYFDHDAFMHHPMHVLDAPACPCLNYVSSTATLMKESLLNRRYINFQIQLHYLERLESSPARVCADEFVVGRVGPLAPLKRSTATRPCLVRTARLLGITKILSVLGLREEQSTRTTWQGHNVTLSHTHTYTHTHTHTLTHLYTPIHTHPTHARTLTYRHTDTHTEQVCNYYQQLIHNSCMGTSSMSFIHKNCSMSSIIIDAW